jgi:hypothetical protein
MSAPQSLLPVFCLICLLSLQGCASPAARLDQAATELGFTRELIRGTDFLHVVYRNHSPPSSVPLHVYLEGDGSPYMHNRWISPDPTARKPLMLQLMALDPEPSVYLARPCYNGLAATPPCEPAFWTDARYSARVVDSTVAAARKLLSREHTPELVLFGHSGGGTLAVLMAEQLPETRAVITLAANLDTDAWARHHDYRPLRASLNPAGRAPLNRHVVQLHFVGGADQIVPPALLMRAVERQAGAQVRIIEGFDHSCCWHTLWPAILDCTDRAPTPPHCGAAAHVRR